MFILLLFFASALVSVIVQPKPSLKSGRQHPALSFLPPGTSHDFVRIKVNGPVEADPYRYAPVDSVVLDGAWLRTFLDGTEMKIHLVDLFYNVDHLSLASLEENETTRYSFIDAFGVEVETSSEALSTQLNDALSTRTFFLGTDSKGRDVLLRLVHGSRIAFVIGLLVTLVSLVIGTFLGMIGGYYRGWINMIVRWTKHVIWSIPAILLVIAFSAGFGSGVLIVVIGISLVQWVEVAQVVQSSVVSIRRSDYIKAARLLGLSNRAIMFHHVFPNIKWSLPVMASIVFSNALVLEAGLSFLGIGVPADKGSWGEMIRSSYGYLVSEQYAYVAIIPSITLVAVVMSMSILTNELRRWNDVRLTSESRGGFV